MAESRHLRIDGHSYVIAVPRWVREHLRARAGAEMYWHRTRKGEVVLSLRAVRTGGAMESHALARRLDEADREVDRLRRKLGARPLAALGEGVSQGWSQAMREAGWFKDALAPVVARLAAIEARLPYRPRAPRRSSARAAPPAPAPAPLDALPSPPPPPSSSSIDGGDAASGAEPPGRPVT